MKPSKRGSQGDADLFRSRFEQSDPRPKIYSLHAPEVECIGKAKAAEPCEFGCKVTVATANARAKGGQFVVHINALHGNPYDGHTLKAAVENAQAPSNRSSVT